MKTRHLHFPGVTLGLLALLLTGCGLGSTLSVTVVIGVLALFAACGAATRLDNDADADADANADADDGDPCPCPAHMTCRDDPALGPWCYPDVDEDGLLDHEDNCPWHADPSQVDLDGDGLGAPCDGCGDALGDHRTPCDTADVDSDGDGFLDPTPEVIGADNCPFLDNADQLDTDGDGFGDICDLEPEIPAVLSPCGDNDIDSDGDGIPNMGACSGGVDDSCPTTPSVQADDRDGDGTADVCDPDGAPPLASLSPTIREAYRQHLLNQLRARGVLDAETAALAARSTALT